MPAKVIISENTLCEIVNDFVVREMTLSEIAKSRQYTIDVVRANLAEFVPEGLLLRQIHLNSKVAKQDQVPWNKGDVGTTFGYSPSQETREKIAASNRGKSRPHTNESKQKISKSMSKLVSQNFCKKTNNWTQGYFQSCKTQKTWFYRSSYELKVLTYLESAKNVRLFQVEPFCIQWVNKHGEIRYYTPDILVKLVNGKEILCEVKPNYKVQTDEIVKLKLDAARKWAQSNNTTFAIITELHLTTQKLDAIFY